VRRALLLTVAALLAASAGQASPHSPQIDYMLQCQGCHLADGRGAPGKVPALQGMARFLSVPGGRAFLVRVPGASQSPLTDAQLAAVLNWMLAHFGPAELAQKQPPYTAGEVSRLRRPPLVDVAGERARLLQALRSGPAPPR